MSPELHSLTSWLHFNLTCNVASQLAWSVSGYSLYTITVKTVSHSKYKTPVLSVCCSEGKCTISPVCGYLQLHKLPVFWPPQPWECRGTACCCCCCFARVSPAERGGEICCWSLQTQPTSAASSQLVHDQHNWMRPTLAHVHEQSDIRAAQLNGQCARY